MTHGALRFSVAWAAVVALAGCGGTTIAAGGSSVGTSGSVLSRVATLTPMPPKTRVRHSWMSRQARAQNLMYVSDTLQSQVYVFSYPHGKLVGTIDVLDPQGMCADAKGHVWITSTTTSQIFEYSHGGTKPIVTLQLPGPQLAVGCSVDPSSGALAVDSFCEYAPGKCVANGSVFVYANTKGTPIQYAVGNAQNVYFCGYDDSGNLFVDAYEGPSGPTVLGKLAKGSSTVELLTVNRPIYFPGGVQWDGNYLAVGDQLAGDEFTSSVHQLSIKGSTATVVSTTKLQGVGDDAQFWIQGKTIVVPNYAVGAPNDARLYTYPAGGSPLRVFGSGTFEEPIGSVVSLATK